MSKKYRVFLSILGVIVCLLVIFDIIDPHRFSYIKFFGCTIIKQGTYEQVKPGESGISEHIGMYACDYVSKGRVKK